MLDWRNELLPPGFSLTRKLPRGVFHEFAQVRDLCKKFQDEFLTSHLKESEFFLESHPTELDQKVLLELNRRGFFSLWLPKLIGGRGFHPLSMNIFNEIIGGQCLGVANIVGAHYFGFGLLATSQNYCLLRQMTKEVLEGEKTDQACLLSAAVTEPTAGTDRENLFLLRKAQLSCFAEKKATGYLLNGRKLFISNAAWARYHIVVTTTQKEHPEKETLILVVPNQSAGLKVETPLRKWGQNACPASEMIFQDCLIPLRYTALSREQFSNEEDYSRYSALVTDSLLALSRAGVASLAAGTCQFVLTESEKWLNQSPSKNEEWLQAKMSELIKNTFLARLISWEASLASHYSTPQEKLLRPFTFSLLKALPTFVVSALGKILEIPSLAASLRKLNFNYDISLSLGLSSLAKFSASDLAHQSVLLALEILGAEAFSNKHNDMEKVLRDSKLLQIYEGTNQLNRIQSFYGLTNVSELQPFEDKASKSHSVWKPELNNEKVALMAQAFQISYQHSLTRQQGGQAIIRWSEHGQGLGQLQMKLENCQHLLKTSHELKDQIRLAWLLDENLLPFISSCMQLMGGKGYLYSSSLPEIFHKALKLRSRSGALEKQSLDFLGEFS